MLSHIVRFSLQGALIKTELIRTNYGTGLELFGRCSFLTSNWKQIYYLTNSFPMANV